MSITQEQIRAALRHKAERTPYITDYRKASDGRVVRFFAWNRASRGEGVAR